MPPRPRAPPSVPDASTTPNLAAQLNPEQLRTLHDHIRLSRGQVGGEVTDAMVNEWMALRQGQVGREREREREQQMQAQAQAQAQMLQMQAQMNQGAGNNGGNGNGMQGYQMGGGGTTAGQGQGQGQGGMDQQQAALRYQQQAQQQAALDQLTTHLFPAHLSSNQPAALAHLQNVLFPIGQGQSPLLQQVMLLASNQRLGQEQLAMLKIAIALKNGAAGESFYSLLSRIWA